MKFDFNLNITKTNRKKTISIVVKNQIVKVLVPNYVDDLEIEKLIESKISWIQKKLYLERNNIIVNNKNYINGEVFKYLGRDYYLIIQPGNSLNIDIVGNKLVVNTINYNSPIKIKEEIKLWYINKAEKKIEVIHRYYESLMKLSANKLIFGEYKSKWGSCNSKKVISYDWRIIMSPITVINYLVVHELSHIVHPNHSKDFWSYVSNYIEDYKDKKKWLRLNSKKLVL